MARSVPEHNAIEPSIVISVNNTVSNNDFFLNKNVTETMYFPLFDASLVRNE